MDVELLARMVGDLILDHDALDLPGLGSFVAQDMPASFSDRGYTINPPYRRLSFTETVRGDSLLAELYARDNGRLQRRCGRKRPWISRALAAFVPPGRITFSSWPTRISTFLLMPAGWIRCR